MYVLIKKNKKQTMNKVDHQLFEHNNRHYKDLVFAHNSRKIHQVRKLKQ